MREANEELAHLEVLDVGKLYTEAKTADVPSGTDAFDFLPPPSPRKRVTSINGTEQLATPAECPWRVCWHRGVELSNANRLLEVGTSISSW